MPESGRPSPGGVRVPLHPPSLDQFPICSERSSAHLFRWRQAPRGGAGTDAHVERPAAHGEQRGGGGEWRRGHSCCCALVRQRHPAYRGVDTADPPWDLRRQQGRHRAGEREGDDNARHVKTCEGGEQ
eukprot:scaffold78330_cov60-Phaeocystis_antarctica.AAC.1